ncbi:hypothetical protein EIL87_12810 [Saccharopolyspora rhizosphaerae]|uniref:Uncharacterized protein n=1 Tax=Saccharopolyspora rhizosphaerae TaxID=2492662 RepID=A0A3R8P5B4_9PSEU|nr:hypothetical protein [Saccharopolyspora rhizosphaerae]RRO16694.1 hypothetical protein EIL87_12810 [Saccharopolyspora rhizosphaerae]
MLSKNQKKTGVLSAAAVLAAAPLLVGALTAQASPVAPPAQAEAMLTCHLNGTAEFSPVLTPSPFATDTRMEITGEAAGCSSADRAAEDIVGATFRGALDGKMSCMNLPRDAAGDFDITYQYADGSTKTSKANLKLDLSDNSDRPAAPAEGALVGKTTAGEFAEANHRATTQFDLASAADECLSEGLESLDFTGQYELSR